VAGMVPAPAGRNVGRRLYNSKCREEVNPGSARESEAALERRSLGAYPSIHAICILPQGVLYDIGRRRSRQLRPRKPPYPTEARS
jgi:hypothetical protein